MPQNFHAMKYFGYAHFITTYTLSIGLAGSIDALTFIKTKSSKNWSLINIHSKVTTTIVVHHNGKQTLKIGETVIKD